ncbi:hypothetical protein JI721_02790 [Alicyclobacillus cycloheptanicus]|uniref:Uncharacterized protein n=1 Tax=Alicyclobacillus cycloheptanicus TaxID=1457 RepID=A0ABT9XL16_9BACL|nr:hypothetical protein [Alicyclobacillus cycloheptanicus]MDQ0190907.1 hypothetical protein [Alicyclobacillus cycloheptanicus]WDM01792.1 hypothetical protein JI721_02790 [Alicyclobacillus cycloheptanicus]
MSEWAVLVRDHPRNKNRMTGILDRPAHHVPYQRLDQPDCSSKLLPLSALEQYVIALFCLRDHVTQRFDNMSFDPAITMTMERLRTFTSKGKAWYQGDRIAALEIRDVCERAKAAYWGLVAQGAQSRIVAQMFVSQQPIPSRVPLDEYIVDRDNVTLEEPSHELMEICNFYETTSDLSPTQVSFGCTVSGWYLHNMHEPDLILRMLSKRYDIVRLLVDPQSGEIRFIRASRRRPFDRG